MATTHRSELIDELEKALRDEVYDGGMGALSPEQLTDYVRGLAVTAAKVVGEAHTPTDDEREGMRRIIAQGSYSRGPEDLPYADVAGRLAAAGFGFRRSEVVQVERATAGASRNCRSIEEPQGEPSDAQVTAEAVRKWPHDPSDANVASARAVRRLSFLQGALWMRAALRAASAVTEQGENRAAAS
ncbi:MULTISPECIES: hypothetical protein [unclassified Microbacterium]|uniref:hypothetical protein n=1 Tax=unclassified Microbacterium TaxID=2609290 RepID=UPI00109B76A5|nr:hypothetical protein [Microbacterium sp. K35]